MIVELTPYEIQLCTLIAGWRKSVNRKAQPHEQMTGWGLDPNYIEREGVLSELAFCKLANIYPDQVFEIGHRSAKNQEDKGDATVNGFCIDVKTTKHQKGRMCAVSINPSIDFVVMMVGEKGYYRFAGGLPAEDIYKKNRWGVPEKMSRPCFSATQEELMTPKQVFNYLT